MERQGMVRVFTGEGKGKTTAALGLAWRAIGRDLKVFMVQFLKAPNTSGEHFAAQAFASQFTLKPMGRKGFIRDRGSHTKDVEMAEKALQEATNAMLGGEYDVVILDEINVAIKLALITVEQLIELVDRKPESVELVLTGRDAHPQIIERADTVLEMCKVKHHYDSGIPAREGIEY